MPAKSATQEPISPPKPDTRIGVLIASEIRLLGEGLARALAHEPSLLVCGYCVELSDAVARANQLRPDVVLLNTTLQSGREVIAHIRATGLDVRVVALAIAEEPENVIGWAEAGAAGYVPTTAALRDLASLLSDIMRGEQPCSARVAASLFERLRTVAHAGNGHAADVPRPTAREMQILEMIGDGLSNKEIARQLNIGVATTKSHVHNLLGKLGLQRRSQAATWIHGRNLGPGLLPRAHGSIRPRV